MFRLLNSCRIGRSPIVRDLQHAQRQDATQACPGRSRSPPPRATHRVLDVCRPADGQQQGLGDGANQRRGLVRVDVGGDVGGDGRVRLICDV